MSRAVTYCVTTVSCVLIASGGKLNLTTTRSEDIARVPRLPTPGPGLWSGSLPNERFAVSPGGQIACGGLKVPIVFDQRERVELAVGGLLLEGRRGG